MCLSQPAALFTPAGQEADGQPDVQDAADLRRAGSGSDGGGGMPAERHGLVSTSGAHADAFYAGLRRHAEPWALSFRESDLATVRTSRNQLCDWLGVPQPQLVAKVGDWQQHVSALL